jgi:pilus assembly protein CpaC
MPNHTCLSIKKSTSRSRSTFALMLSVAYVGAAPAADQPVVAPAPEALPVARAGQNRLPVAHVSSKSAPGSKSLAYLDKKSLSITLGAIELLPIKGKIVRVALGSGTVISTTAVDSHLMVIAEQLGATSLMIWTDREVYTYRVEVVPKELADVRAKVNALVADMPGISVQPLGSELVVSGTVHREALARLKTVLKDVPGVLFNVTEDLGSPYARSVLFRLHFIEVKKSLIEKIGIDWAKDAQGPTFGAAGVVKDDGTYKVTREIQSGDSPLTANPDFYTRGAAKGGLFFGLATTITSRINLGISNGDVRVLASPELIAKSGGTAKLQVGGEVPIPVAAGLGTVNVTFKPYGVMFSIAPRIDANNVITAVVSTELSQIDPSVTVGGIPGFLNRSTSTEVSLKSGEMVALSGLVLGEMSNAIDRLPGLSAIPMFGKLFQSADFRDRKTELVVLLEPEIINAGDGLAQQLKARGQANVKEFEEKVKEQNRKPPPAAGYDDLKGGN